ERVVQARVVDLAREERAEHAEEVRVLDDEAGADVAADEERAVAHGVADDRVRDLEVLSHDHLRARDEVSRAEGAEDDEEARVAAVAVLARASDGEIAVDDDRDFTDVKISRDDGVAVEVDEVAVEGVRGETLADLGLERARAREDEVGVPE